MKELINIIVNNIISNIENIVIVKDIVNNLPLFNTGVITILLLSMIAFHMVAKRRQFTLEVAKEKDIKRINEIIMTTAVRSSLKPSGVISDIHEYNKILCSDGYKALKAGVETVKDLRRKSFHPDFSKRG